VLKFAYQQNSQLVESFRKRIGMPDELRRMRHFYTIFPIHAILPHEFSWSHYRLFASGTIYVAIYSTKWHYKTLSKRKSHNPKLRHIFRLIIVTVSQQSVYHT
jgi:hypothetical protein